VSLAACNAVCALSTGYLMQGRRLVALYLGLRRSAAASTVTG